MSLVCAGVLVWVKVGVGGVVVSAIELVVKSVCNSSVFGGVLDIVDIETVDESVDVEIGGVWEVMGTEVVFKMVKDDEQDIGWVGTMMLGSGMMLLDGVGLQMYLLSKLVAKVLILAVISP